MCIILSDIGGIDRFMLIYNVKHLKLPNTALGLFKRIPDIYVKMVFYKNIHLTRGYGCKNYIWYFMLIGLIKIFKASKV